MASPDSRFLSLGALQALARIQEVERLARGKVNQDFHQAKVRELDAKCKAALSEKAQASAEVQRVTEELREVTARAEEAAKAVSH